VIVRWPIDYVGMVKVNARPSPVRRRNPVPWKSDSRFLSPAAHIRRMKLTGLDWMVSRGSFLGGGVGVKLPIV
jgi:hypothetical protein